MLKFLLCGVFAMGMLGTASAQNLTLLSSWDDRYAAVRYMADAYIEKVQAATDLTIRRVGPEVIPFSQQLQPASAGAFDMLFSHGGYHPGSTGVGVVLDAVTASAEQMRSSGIWDYVDNHYQKNFNLKLLSAPQAGSTGYQFLTKQPAGADNLNGFKLRATNSADTLVKALGASRVVMPPEDTFSSLEKGVIEGTGWAMLGALDYKWYEVLSYYVRPAYGRSTHLIFINLDSWNKLDEATRTVMLDEGKKLEDTIIPLYDDLIAKEEAALEAKGMKRTDLALSQEEVNALSSAGMWANAMTSELSRSDVEKLREMAREHGLSD